MLGVKGMLKVVKSVYGLDSPDVFSAMEAVTREEFVSQDYRSKAYDDCALPIGFGQTLSQPYTVAFMTDLLVSFLDKANRNKVLEIGTGSGYQAAVLSKLFKKVYTIEIIPELASSARKTLEKLDFKNIYLKEGSGEWGWKENSPFDAIMITAAIKNKVPEELFKELKNGGMLVVPLGKEGNSVMTTFRKMKSGKLIQKKHGVFSFVPFVKDGQKHVS